MGIQSDKCMNIRRYVGEKREWRAAVHTGKEGVNCEVKYGAL